MKKQIEKIDKTKISDIEKKQFDEIAEDLANKYGVSKVHVYVGIQPNTNERIVCYLREPNYLQKIAVMNKIATAGAYIAAEEMRENLTLKDESNYLTYGEGNECDAYKLGVVGFCLQLGEVIQNALKKN